LRQTLIFMLYLKGAAGAFIIIFLILRYLKRKTVNSYSSVRIDDRADNSKNRQDSFPKSTKTNGKTLVFDIETTGFPLDTKGDLKDSKNWPRIVSIGWFLFDDQNALIEEYYSVIKQKYKVPAAAAAIHGITKEISLISGRELKAVLDKTLSAIENSSVVVAHNLEFDLKILQATYFANGYELPFANHQKVCTMKSTTEYCGIPHGRGRGFKYPKLEELGYCAFPFGHRLSNASLHNSKVDAELTAMCYFKLYATIQRSRKY
jgi:DNA polymerase III epsilon subunit-like protein